MYCTSKHVIDSLCPQNNFYSEMDIHFDYPDSELFFKKIL